MELSLNQTVQTWPSLRSVLLGQESSRESLAQSVRHTPAKTMARSRVKVARPEPSALQSVWQGFLKLTLIVTMSLGFAWFGPDATTKLSSTITGLENGQTLQELAQVSAPDFADYTNKVTQWLSQVRVTPIAGQSGQSNELPAVIAPLEPAYQPPYDETLPDGSWLSIPLIGLRSELQKTEDYDAALAKGIWQVPDFGDAGSTELPMIVAGHRFGWDWWWKTDYWKYHSFYRLPELQVGDRVEVIADHRKWIYEIYAATEGEEIADYSADLILYTCKYLNSPARFFRYAKLIDPTKNTQVESVSQPASIPNVVLQ